MSDMNVRYALACREVKEESLKIQRYLEEGFFTR